MRKAVIISFLLLLCSLPMGQVTATSGLSSWNPVPTVDKDNRIHLILTHEFRGSDYYSTDDYHMLEESGSFSSPKKIGIESFQEPRKTALGLVQLGDKLPYEQLNIMKIQGSLMSIDTLITENTLLNYHGITLKSKFDIWIRDAQIIDETTAYVSWYTETDLRNLYLSFVDLNGTIIKSYNLADIPIDDYLSMLPRYIWTKDGDDLILYTEEEWGKLTQRIVLDNQMQLKNVTNLSLSLFDNVLYSSIVSDRYLTQLRDNSTGFYLQLIDLWNYNTTIIYSDALNLSENPMYSIINISNDASPRFVLISDSVFYLYEITNYLGINLISSYDIAQFMEDNSLSYFIDDRPNSIYSNEYRGAYNGKYHFFVSFSSSSESNTEIYRVLYDGTTWYSPERITFASDFTDDKEQVAPFSFYIPFVITIVLITRIKRRQL